MNPRSFLEMLAEADLVLLNGHKVEFQTSELSEDNDDENQIVCFSYAEDDLEDVIFNEGDVRKGMVREDCLLFDDGDGGFTFINIYRQVQPVNLTKRVVSLHFTMSNVVFPIEVSDQDMEEMEGNLRDLSEFAFCNGLTSVGEDGAVTVVAWGVTTEGMRATSNETEPAAVVPVTSSEARISEIQQWITKGWLSQTDICQLLYGFGVLEPGDYLAMFTEPLTKDMVRGLLSADLGELDYQEEVDRAQSNIKWAVEENVIKPCEYASLLEQYGLMTLEEFGQAMEALAETYCQT